MQFVSDGLLEPIVDPQGGVIFKSLRLRDALWECVVELKADPQGDRVVCKPNKQWFNISVQGIRIGSFFRLIISNASSADCAPNAFENYRVCALPCGPCKGQWFRMESTTFGECGLICDYVPLLGYPDVQISYFPPFDANHHLFLLESARHSSLCTVESIGLSNEGQSIDAIHFQQSNSAARDISKCQMWIVSRQHPSETQSEWWCEGLIKRLLVSYNNNDSTAIALLERADIHIIPCINPDGAFLFEYTRTNAMGCNLNREWSEPSSNAPEVIHTLAAMGKTGVDCFLDIHSDESLEAGAITCCSPAWTPRLLDLQNRFSSAYQASAGPLYDEESSKKYLLLSCQRAEDATGIKDGLIDGRMDQMQLIGVDLSLASTQVGHRYDCLSLTLEQPFKDCIAQFENESGPLGLGAAVVEPLVAVLPYLR